MKPALNRSSFMDSISLYRAGGFSGSHMIAWLPLALLSFVLIWDSAVFAGTTAYRNEVLSDAPIVYYEFDETSGTTSANSGSLGTALDATINTSSGTVTIGQSSFSQGGNSYSFGGGVATAAALTNSLDEWTVEAWLNYSNGSTSNFLSNDQGDWNDDILFGIGAENNNIPANSVGLVHQGNPGSVRETVASPLASGTWHHVVMTGSNSAGEFKLYVNGALVDTNNALTNGATFNGADGFGTGTHLTMGASRPDGLRPYGGFLDEVAVYGQVLDTTTIISHYNAGITSSPGTPPTISGLSPTDGADDVALSSNMVITFSEPMALTGAAGSTITLRNLGPGADTVITLPDAQVTVSGAALTINPATDLLPNTNYALQISANALEDTSGDAFAGILNDEDWNFMTVDDSGGGGGTATSGFGLTVTTYVPSSDPIQLRWPTHIAFGPGQQEIISDHKNNRLVYRNTPSDPWLISPVSLSGVHSVVYNPADGLYYANDTNNQRIIAFSDLSSGTIAAQTSSIAGVTLSRPHDILIDPATNWIYALNPNSGHVFRFTAIGQNESVIQAPTGGYARALTWANGKLYVIGSSKGRIVEVVDWDTPKFNIYDSFDPSGSGGSAGSWTKTGLVLNDAEYFDGYWYATSYFTSSYAGGTDYDENKFIRFKTLDDMVTGNWTDLSSLIPSGLNPYFLTVNGDTLHLVVWNHESAGNGDSVLKFTPIVFSEWISGFSGLGGQTELDDDPDADGLGNGLEAWFGTHPGEKNSGVVLGSTVGLVTTFTHPKNTTPPDDLTGYYEWSPDLTDWLATGTGSSGGATVTFSASTSGSTTTVTATASEAVERIFLRVRVTQN